jgi:sugar O-acyltransferase (sialic acid O-acetyltransferase NeuD family)
MENPVIILGAKGLGAVALEIFQSNGVVVYCFLDDDTSLHNTEIQDVSVMGSTDDDGYLKLIGKKCEAFVASDDNRYRKSLTEMLLERRKMMPVNAIHARAHLAGTATIGHGNFIAAGVIIGTNAKVGSHCVLHTGCVVDYTATIGDYVQIGAGTIINSGATVENGAFIGSGVTVVSGVTIGKSARVGAGSVVVESVKSSGTVFGNPAAPLEKK